MLVCAFYLNPPQTEANPATESLSPLGIESNPAIENKFTGNWKAIRERRLVRFLVPYSKTFFFWDGATPRGLIYDKIMAFEKKINRDLSTRNIQIHTMIIPTQRKDLFQKLNDGYGDVVAANLTITPERSKLVDFSDPFQTNVKELLVSHKLHKTYTTIYDLSGTTISVRESSSYFSSLKKINEILADFEKEPISIGLIQDSLEDEDILELINNKIIELTIVDNSKAIFWAKILPDIFIHQEPIISKGNKIAWATRKKSPELMKALNSYIRTAKQGTLVGNMLLKKYLQNTKYIKGALDSPNVKLFEKLSPLFKKYGAKYNFDPLMLTALAYQESKLKQSARSSKGAVGIMQILPSTASFREVGIKNINKLENNIHAGSKYLRYLADTFFPESEHMDQLNRTLLTFAAYNAGPGRVRYLRKVAKRKGYDPNKWFQNVEIIAAEVIGRETVRYVSNIYKYYLTYKLLSKSLNPPQWPPQEETDNCSFSDKCTEFVRTF